MPTCRCHGIRREEMAVQTETERVQHNEQRIETETENLAAVLGPTLMALTASEAVNYHIWDTQFPAVTYLNGLFIFVAGASILRKERRWTRRWPVLVTIIGWIAVVMATLDRVMMLTIRVTAP